MQLRSWSLFLIIVLFFVTGCETGQSNPSQNNTSGEELFVHFIDVGQGDATLLQGPDFTVLVDAGRHDRQDVIPYLQQVGVNELDLLVGTHPHADHIGQMDQVLQTFPVKEVWMSGDEHTTRTFERTIDAILQAEADYYEPRAGETFAIGSLVIDVFNPEQLTGDFHEGSLSMKFSYGEFSILLTGDAENQTEEWMLSQPFDLHSTIFQLGHHGSTTSNTEPFLLAVEPEIAIYSAGKDNEYGHPHREIIELLNHLEIPVYGTDFYGSIIVVTDGKGYEIQTEKNPKETVQTEESQHEKNEAKMLECININEATPEQLVEIVHIGEERIEQLLQFRPYDTMDELTKINGIGSGRLAEIVEQGLACLE